MERSGLINLKDPKASVLKSGDEPIQIYFYVLDHPQFGRYAIDTGISKVFRKDSKEWPVSWLVVFGMNTKTLKIRETTDEWLNKNPKKVEGIFLTHMHLDHILGSPDFQPNVPIYVGPKETTGKKFLNLFVQGSTDRVLGENPTLYELNFQEGRKDSPVRILDFFRRPIFTDLPCGRSYQRKSRVFSPKYIRIPARFGRFLPYELGMEKQRDSGRFYGKSGKE